MVLWAPWALVLSFLGPSAGDQYDFPPASWVKASSDSAVFSARNGHGAVVFRDGLWVVGGRTESYTAYNLESTQRRGDVWHSADYGVTWAQIKNLTGDFYVQNFDAPSKGSLAPWYARFGHTLDVVSATNSAGAEIDLMVLTGGFTPTPSNDVWATADGIHWRYVHQANWTARAWHASAVLDGRLFVLGGAPLSNDVWAASAFGQDGDGTWHSCWSLISEPLGSSSSSSGGSSGSVPWSPRAGLAVAALPHVNGTILFVAGGFGGWPAEDPRYDGVRARNDIFRSSDGAVWEPVSGAAPWSPRAWHAMAAWHNLSDPLQDVAGAPTATDAAGKAVSGDGPRLWLAGGGYLGTDGNRAVRTMEGYVDVWWSYDGASWVQANYEEGSGSNLYSSMEWAVAETDDGTAYVGKWGHRLVAWQREYSSSAAGGIVPALYLVAGDTVGTGVLVNDVFRSNDTLLCSVRGIVCGDAGTCNSDGLCECDDGIGGDFCTEGTAHGTSGAAQLFWRGWHSVAVPVAAFAAVALLTDRLS